MENKAFLNGEVRKFDKKIAEETRTIEFVISDETKDRHGTVIPVSAWSLDNFNKNGIAGYQHDVYGAGDPDPDKILGIAKAWVEGKELIGSITFEPKEINPFAEKLFRKVLNGTLKAVSVGFREMEKGSWGNGDEDVNGKNPTYYFKKVELLEFSIVNIPSNPNAIRRELKDNALEIRNRELTSEVERLGSQLMEMAKQVEELQRLISMQKEIIIYYNKRIA